MTSLQKIVQNYAIKSVLVMFFYKDYLHNKGTFSKYAMQYQSNFQVKFSPKCELLQLLKKAQFTRVLRD